VTPARPEAAPRTGLFLIAIAFACTALLLAAGCGGDSQVTLTMRPDLSDLPDTADADTTIQEIVDILSSRAASFDAGSAEFAGDNGTIVAAVSGMDIDVARRLFLPTAEVSFREPLLSQSGLMVCTDANGETFEINPLQVNPDSATGNKARCFGDRQLGDPLWAAPRTVSIGGEDKTLADLVERGGWERRDETTLAVRFDEDGSALLEEVTAGLIGYPLGVFVDDELIAAPRIQRAITNGNPLIYGFDELEAGIRQAQLNASPLPAPLSEIAAE